VKAIFRLLVSVGLLAALAGCEFTLPATPLNRRTPTSSPADTQTTTPPAGQTAVPGGDLTLTPAPDPNLNEIGTSEPPDTLRIWVPAQFDPGAGSTMANLLSDRLREFEAAHPGLHIEVRIKAPAGPGGLLDALTAAYAAAPAALPDLVALNRSDLETAALKGYLYPFDGLTTLPDDPDWFNFARQLTLIQGSTFGLPFAGDALVLLYRPAQVPTPPKDWDALLHQANVIAFPAADPQALFTLGLYEAAGGQVADAQRRPILDATALTTVLKLYETGKNSGQFPIWLTQYETDGQAWQAFREKRSAWVVTWISRYLTDLPADATLLPLPPINNNSLTLATGWEWALASPQPAGRTLAVELATFLEESTFLARWTAAAGYLPPRPTALALWPNQSLQSLVSQVTATAQARPSNDLKVSLGPVLKEAALQVLKGGSDPVKAAQSAAEHIKGP
jgi:multiple sugar transport system substrate-binding protein